MVHCIRCKRKFGKLVTLQPVSVKPIDTVEGPMLSKKYMCKCGCTFERISKN